MLAVERRIRTRSAGAAHCTCIPPPEYEYTQEVIFKVAGAMVSTDQLKVVALLSVTEPDLVSEIFDTARLIKNQIYGNRLVLFAPLYISNLCENDCAYCGFRAANRGMVRRSLSQDEIRDSIKRLGKELERSDKKE
jgi:2-iminoacetate synthase